MNFDATGMWDWDLKADRIYFDAATARMYSFDRVLGHEGLKLDRFLARMHPDDRARIDAELADTIKAGGRFSATFRIERPESGYRWVYGRGSCLQSESLTTARFPGINYDLGLASDQSITNFLSHDAAADLLLAAHDVTELLGDKILTSIVKAALLRLARISSSDSDHALH